MCIELLFCLLGDDVAQKVIQTSINSVDVVSCLMVQLLLLLMLLVVEIEVGGLPHEVVGETAASHVCLGAVVGDGVAQLTHATSRT